MVIAVLVLIAVVVVVIISTGSNTNGSSSSNASIKSSSYHYIGVYVPIYIYIVACKAVCIHDVHECIHTHIYPACALHSFFMFSGRCMLSMSCCSRCR